MNLKASRPQIFTNKRMRVFAVGSWSYFVPEGYSWIAWEQKKPKRKILVNHTESTAYNACFGVVYYYCYLCLINVHRRQAKIMMATITNESIGYIGGWLLKTWGANVINIIARIRSNPKLKLCGFVFSTANTFNNALESTANTSTNSFILNKNIYKML